MNCLVRKKIAPEIPVSFVRHNGWTLPLNFFQVFSWIILVYLAIVYFAIIAAYVDKVLWTLSFGISGFIFLMLLVFLLWAMSVDPGDDNSIKRHEDTATPLPVFDRTRHDHVIENNYCHICEVQVAPRSKHCSSCNKCVAVFDHHCKWLNNCVGEKNYRIFFVTLILAILESGLMLGIAFFVFIEIVRNLETLSLGIWWNNSQTSRIIVLVFIGLTICFLIIIFGLVCHLYGFHIMLKCRNMTTCEYIVAQRNKKEEREVKRVGKELATKNKFDAIISGQSSEISKKSWFFEKGKRKIFPEEKAFQASTIKLDEKRNSVNANASNKTGSDVVVFNTVQSEASDDGIAYDLSVA